MSSALRDELHQILDGLDDEQLAEAEKRLREIGAEEDDLDPSERKALNDALAESWKQAQAGQLRPLKEVLDKLDDR